jgi:hypothetical protein
MSLLLLRITQDRLVLFTCFVILGFILFFYQFLRFGIIWGYTESLSWKYSCKHGYSISHQRTLDKGMVFSALIYFTFRGTL